MCDVDRLVKLAFSGLSPLVVEEVADDGELVRVQARTPQAPARCPRCGVATSRVHGYHRRTLTWPPSSSASTAGPGRSSAGAHPPRSSPPLWQNDPVSVATITRIHPGTHGTTRGQFSRTGDSRRFAADAELLGRPGGCSGPCHRGPTSGSPQVRSSGGFVTAMRGVGVLFPPGCVRVPWPGRAPCRRGRRGRSGRRGGWG